MASLRWNRRPCNGGDRNVRWGHLAPTIEIVDKVTTWQPCTQSRPMRRDGSGAVLSTGRVEKFVTAWRSDPVWSVGLVWILWCTAQDSPGLSMSRLPLYVPRCTKTFAGHYHCLLGEDRPCMDAKLRLGQSTFVTRTAIRMWESGSQLSRRVMRERERALLLLSTVTIK